VNVSYKNTVQHTLTGTREIEFHVDDRNAAEQFLAAPGLAPHCRQEKRRHTFRLNAVTVGNDTRPNVPLTARSNLDKASRRVHQLHLRATPPRARCISSGTRLCSAATRSEYMQSCSTADAFA